MEVATIAIIFVAIMFVITLIFIAKDLIVID